MSLALQYAEQAARAGEVPVGAVLVAADSGAVIAAAHNLTITLPDPTAHAEMLVLREGARRVGAARLVDCVLYVTLEPCPMCAQAISFARLRRVVFGAYDPKGGAVEHGPRLYQQPTCHHQPEVVGGVMAQEAGALLQRFFQERRVK
jgi:tRNA(Arg) A34 adenosine deaminase TadA